MTFRLVPDLERLKRMAGWPVTLPLTWSDAGLPIGVQFVGRYGDEAGLYRLAGQLEQAQPWADRRPSDPA